MRYPKLLVTIAVILLVLVFLVLYYGLSAVTTPPKTATTTASMASTTPATTQNSTTSTTLPSPATLPAGTGSTGVGMTSSVPIPNTAQTYSAHLGDSITASGYTFTVTNLLSDNRCPVDVQCIQAGTVQVQVRIAKGLFSTTQTFTLGTPVSGFSTTGELVAVSPDRTKESTINPQDYTFTFKVWNS